MIAILLWKWQAPNGPNFSAMYVNKMHSMLARNLRLPHRTYCITDNEQGIHRDVITIPLPSEFNNTPRCRRRMKQYDASFAGILGRRILSLDLDMVITGDITPLVDRAEPVVLWKVGYAGVYSGSFVLYDAGALDGLYRAYKADPDGYPKRAQPKGCGSDQSMMNLYLAGRKVPHWTERDGFRTWFGDGYAESEHHGMSAARHELTAGARVVVLGSADKGVMDSGAYPFVTEHWQ